MSDRKISVAFVVNSVLIAGAEITVFETAAHLDRERFTPVVYILRDYTDRPTLASRFQEAGVPLVFLESGKKVGISSAIRLLRARFKGSRPDIVHCHLPDAVIAGGVAAVSMGIPFIIHEDQTHRFHSWKIRLAYRLLRLRAALTICFAAVVEEELFGYVHELHEPPQWLESKVCTIHNGVDIAEVARVRGSTDHNAKRAQLGIASKDILIVSAARFVEWKGHRLLIEAFASVADKIPTAHLFIAGEGPLHAELSARVRKLGLEDRVFMPGVRTDVYEILAVADIFCLAFTYPQGLKAEAIGVAGFEAMAFGLPVIAGRYVGADTYLGDSERGIIVAPSNQAALSDALVSLADDAGLRTKLGSAAHAFSLHELDWNALIKIYERIYTLILGL